MSSSVCKMFRDSDQRTSNLVVGSSPLVSLMQALLTLSPPEALTESGKLSVSTQNLPSCLANAFKGLGALNLTKPSPIVPTNAWSTALKLLSFASPGSFSCWVPFFLLACLCLGKILDPGLPPLLALLLQDAVHSGGHALEVDQSLSETIITIEPMRVYTIVNTP